MYVNQHDFFINRVRESNNHSDDELYAFLSCPSSRLIGCISWEHLPDPDASVPTTESALAELFNEIRTTVGQEVQIVQAVFPNPAYVMQVFLQRVFAQSVSVLMSHNNGTLIAHTIGIDSTTT